MTSDSDFNPSPPAPTGPPKTPPKKTTGVDPKMIQGVRDPVTGDFVPTPTVSAGSQGSETDASPSSEFPTGLPRLTRAGARALGVKVQPELAQSWTDHDKPYHL